MQLVQLRQNLLDSYHLGVVDGRSKSQLRGGKRRIGIIDGSGFGRLLYSTSVKIELFSAMVPWHALSSHLAKSAVSGHAQYTTVTCHRN